MMARERPGYTCPANLSTEIDRIEADVVRRFPRRPAAVRADPGADLAEAAGSQEPPD